MFQTVLGFVREPEAEIAAIEKVTPDQVMAAFKELKPHTEFRLAP